MDYTCTNTKCKYVSQRIVVVCPVCKAIDAFPDRDGQIIPNASYNIPGPEAEALKEEAAQDAELHEAVRAGDTQKVKDLIRKGADINSRSAAGTPLHIAAGHADEDMVDVLLDLGADPRVTDRRKDEGGNIMGETPDKSALSGRSGKVVNALKPAEETKRQKIAQKLKARAENKAISDALGGDTGSVGKDEQPPRKM